MESKKTLSEKWKNILNIISEKFNKGDDLDIESVIYLIGVQEFGNPNMKFNKDQKIDLDAYCSMPLIRALWIL